MAWLSKRWVKHAWLDTLLKQLLHVAVAAGITFGVFLGLALWINADASGARDNLKSGTWRTDYLA